LQNLTRRDTEIFFIALAPHGRKMYLQAREYSDLAHSVNLKRARKSITTNGTDEQRKLHDYIKPV
jgi:hypothetical protein